MTGVQTCALPICTGLQLAGGTLNVTNLLTVLPGATLTGGASANTSIASANVQGTVNPNNTAMNISTLNLLVGGVLKGNGTINGTVNNNGGSVSPGNSPGVLTISGNYVQGPTGTLNIEIGGLAVPGTNYDRVNVLGNTTLNGTLAVQQFNSFVPSPGNGVSFITTGGSSTGQFTTILLPPAFAGMSVVYGSRFTDLLLPLNQPPAGSQSQLIASTQPILIYEERDIFTEEEKKDIFNYICK